MKDFNFTKDKDLEVHSEETLYKGFAEIKVYKLRHRLFEGGWSDLITREIASRKPIAAALPYDPCLDKVVLIEQCRIGAIQARSPWLLEAVAGMLGDQDQNPEELITRELKEESGLEASKLHKICEYWVSPGGSSEYLTLYCAEVDAREAGGIHGLPEEHEDIYVHVVNRQEAYDMVQSGRINNALSIIAIQWLQLNLHIFNDKR
jgi:ADP-ribose pyrophosphatase